MDNDRYYHLGSYDKLFNQIDELTDALASRDAEVATLKAEVTLLRDRLSDVLTTRTVEAIASMALANAEENFTDSHIELASHTKAIVDSSNAEKLAREALIATEIGNDI